ncbi:MAG TPA: YkgJ family cysteine cluster protein [Polyangiaceae bacterium]
MTTLAGAEHLGFRCNRCGDCCRGLRVALTHHDLSRLVRALGASPASLVDWLAPEEVDFAAEAESFVVFPEGPRLMVLAHERGACRQIADDGSCGAYAARPLDCRLYPFVLERDEERRVRKLALFDPRGCGERGAELESLTVLECADAERWAALEEYGALVARWNRFARHRARLGHRTRDRQDFFAFLGHVGCPEPSATPASQAQ